MTGGEKAMVKMIRNPRDFYAGLLFVAFGAVALVIVQAYAIGTAARMGPGYFPRLFGIMLAGGWRHSGVDQACARSPDSRRVAFAAAVHAPGRRRPLHHGRWLGFVGALVVAVVASAACRDVRWPRRCWSP